MGGPSGLVLVPTGQVVRPGWYAIGLNRGSLKAAYGLPLTEAGVALPDLFDSLNAKKWGSGTRGFIKVGGDLFPAAWWWSPGLAAGAENSLRGDSKTFYLAATWDGRIRSWPMEATVGAGTGRFENRAFAAIGIIPASVFGRTMKFIAEYAGRQADFGTRIALSKNLRLDFVMLINAHTYMQDGRKMWTIRLDRGVLGASRTGAVDWSSLKTKKKNPQA